MAMKSTTLLRGRGADEEQPVVAVLDYICAKNDNLTRKGLHDEGKLQELSCWDTDDVVPVGDRFMYWADYRRGVILCDVRREPTPELRYVSLPVKPVLLRRSPSRPSPSPRGR